MAALVRLTHYLRPYLWRVTGLLISMIATAGFSLAVPWLTKLAIDEGIRAPEPTLLYLLAGGVVLTTLLRGIAAFGQTYLGEYLSQRIAYDLRNFIYDHIQRLSFAFHDRNQTGQLMSRATADVEAVRMFFNWGIPTLLQTVFLLVGIMIILIQANPRLAIIPVIFLPVAGVSATLIGKQVRPVWNSIQQQTAVLTTYLQESFAGIRVVRAFAREPERISGFADVNWGLHRLNVRASRLQAFQMPFLTMLLGLATAASLWIGGRDVVASELTVGDLAAFIGYLTLLGMPARRLGFMVNMFARTVASADRIFDLLDTKSDVEERPHAHVLHDITGRVRFENVSFSYGERSAVLTGIDIDARPGQVVALLGATGSGKSTITLLLPRFYDVTDGRILIDDHDIRDVTIASLRRQIGLVLQDTFLFSATIRDNIAYGAESMSMERITEAARLAGAHDFIMRFPDGYDTWVGERGVTLSGGQKQRIAIARTLLLNPRILILDDSTSSVDTQTEFQIQQALQSLMVGRTTFVIAQRLRTVKSADQILVLNNGKIVERGTHDELLQHEGFYRAIYDLQLRDQEEMLARVEEIGAGGQGPGAGGQGDDQPSTFNLQPSTDSGNGRRNGGDHRDIRRLSEPDRLRSFGKKP